MWPRCCYVCAAAITGASDAILPILIIPVSATARLELDGAVEVPAVLRLILHARRQLGWRATISQRSEGVFLSLSAEHLQRNLCLLFIGGNSGRDFTSAGPPGPIRSSMAGNPMGAHVLICNVDAAADRNNA